MVLLLCASLSAVFVLLRPTNLFHCDRLSSSRRDWYNMSHLEHRFLPRGGPMNVVDVENSAAGSQSCLPALRQTLCSSLERQRMVRTGPHWDTGLEGGRETPV